MHEDHGRARAHGETHPFVWSAVPTVGETGAVGQATVRESSLSVVSPPSTFMTPSSRMVRMPSRRAWRRISDEGATRR